MSAIFWWIGVAHVAVYAVAGTAFFSGYMLSKMIDWTGNSRLILQAVGRIFRERKEAKDKAEGKWPA